MDVINTALNIAYKAHEGQVDKSGEPYILHPLRVALLTETNKCVALLHDVLEDTAVTEDDLRQEGIYEYIIQAVVALTRKKNEDYYTYLQRVKSNPIACKIKIKDIEDNLNPIRLAKLDEKTRTRLHKKYANAHLFLAGIK